MVETNVLASSKIFGYNVLGISLQNGQTFLPTAKLVDYRLCSQLFFSSESISCEFKVKRIFAIRFATCL